MINENMDEPYLSTWLQCKPTPPEQPQKARNYVYDAAVGYFMLKYVLSPNLIIFVSLFQISGAKKKKNLLYCYEDLTNISLKPKKHLTANSQWQKYSA